MEGTYRSIPATSFVLFNNLCEELRVQIWKSAFPGPRIVFLQRCPLDWVAEHNEAKYMYWPERTSTSSREPCYFTSTSPTGSIPSLVRVCKESRALVKKHYSIIFPGTQAWFSFSDDYLFINWGILAARRRLAPRIPCYFDAPYGTSEFLSSAYGFFDRNYGETLQSMAKKVKNLIIHQSYHRPDLAYGYKHLEQWLVREVLELFTGVKILVLADQLFDYYEFSDELVWIGEELEAVIGERPPHSSDYPRPAPSPQAIDQFQNDLRSLILWKHGTCLDVYSEAFQEEWERFIGGSSLPSRQIPRLARGIAISAAVKNKLMRICQSDKSLRDLTDLDWQFVEGDHDHRGSLNISQQVAYLELVLSRTRFCTDPHELGVDPARDEVLNLIARIDELVIELELDEQVIIEAEQCN